MRSQLYNFRGHRCTTKRIKSRQRPSMFVSTSKHGSYTYN